MALVSTMYHPWTIGLSWIFLKTKEKTSIVKEIQKSLNEREEPNLGNTTMQNRKWDKVLDQSKDGSGGRSRRRGKGEKGGALVILLSLWRGYNANFDDALYWIFGAKETWRGDIGRRSRANRVVSCKI